MVDERIKKLELAMEDAEFEEKVANVESEKELKELFASKGIDMSDEEVSSFCEKVRSVLEEGGDELSEDALDDVAGGMGIIGGLTLVGACYVAGRIYGNVAKKKIGWCKIRG